MRCIRPTVRSDPGRLADSRSCYLPYPCRAHFRHAFAYGGLSDATYLLRPAGALLLLVARMPPQSRPATPRSANRQARTAARRAEVTSLAVSSSQPRPQGHATTRSSSSSPATLNERPAQDLTGDVTVRRSPTQGRPRHHRRPGLPAGQRHDRRSPPLRRQDASRSASTSRACDDEPADQLRQPDRADLHQARLQPGGCHGKSGGQNGFAPVAARLRAGARLHDPGQGGPRPAPLPRRSRHSLLLLKATGPMAHGGGKRMEVGSDEYKLIRRWIAAGTPFGNDERSRSSPRSPSIPSTAIIDRNNRQQFAVYAHYTDGTIEDVTRRAQYESNDPEIAVVDGAGLVRTLDMSGEAAIMARYQGQVAVFRATVPLGVQDSRCTSSSRRPSSISFTQQEMAGTRHRPVRAVHRRAVHPPRLPRHHRHAADADAGQGVPRRQGPGQARQADRSPAGDAGVQLSTSPTSGPTSCASSGGNQPDRAYGTFAFHDWIREAIASDKPYDQFVREILGAIGDEIEVPADGVVQGPANARAVRGRRLPGVPRPAHAPAPSATTIRTRSGARTITGAWPRSSAGSAARRCRCPACSAEPAATSGRSSSPRPPATSPTSAPSKPAVMRPLDGEPMTVDAGRRSAPEAGRLDGRCRRTRSSPGPWPIATGRTSSAAASSIRSTTCASPIRRRNPELLDALAKDLVDNKYSLKHLVRTICKSRTYQLSADAERVQQARQADLRPLLSAAHDAPRCCSTRSAR